MFQRLGSANKSRNISKKNTP